MNELSAAEFESRFPSLRRVVSRLAFLRDASSGRSVVHVGCVDAGLYDGRRREGRLLHGELAKVATHLVGVDVDRDGIERMRRDGFGDLYAADVTRAIDRATLLAALHSGQPPELIICGEVIEHVDDPVALVRGLLDLARAFGAECILTTPNPFYYGRFLRAAGRAESVHPDHNAYLSLSNLATVHRKAGGRGRLTVVAYANLDGGGPVAALKRFVTGAFPYLSDGLIVSFAD